MANLQQILLASYCPDTFCVALLILFSFLTTHDVTQIMPTGWKYREMGPRKDKEFLSREGFVFRLFFEAISFKNGF